MHVFMHIPQSKIILCLCWAHTRKYELEHKQCKCALKSIYDGIKF